MISCSETQKNRLPNIVLIFMDDLGYGDIANFGAINYRTPNIDRMMNEGMLFTNFSRQYVAHLEQDFSRELIPIESGLVGP